MRSKIHVVKPISFRLVFYFRGGEKIRAGSKRGTRRGGVHEADTCVPLSVSVSKGEGRLKKSGWRGKRKERRRRIRIRGGGGGRNVVTENATRWSKRWRRRTHEEGVRRVLAG